MYHYKTEQFLPITIDEAWNFFSSPHNLALITPPELGFRITSNIQSSGIFEGQQIEYIVKPLLGIPLKWKTEIGEISIHHFFIDKQIKGPYKKWEHKHLFTEHLDGVMMRDIVEYELPFGLIGKFAHRLFIRKKIESIFKYRESVLSSFFPVENRNSYFELTELGLI